MWTKLIAAEAMGERVRAAGRRIAADFAGREPLLVGLLRGAIYFLADLARAIPIPVEIETMRVQSYAGTGSTGRVEVVDDLRCDVAGRDVLVVDDIYDSGRTLSFVRELLQGRGARSIEFACLLVKDAPRVAPVEVKYGLFRVPNVFVVGAGLDLDGVGRNLPDVWALEEGVAADEAAAALRRQFPALAQRA
jgi:hypoxanthine phosphoribosyltransferase